MCWVEYQPDSAAAAPTATTVYESHPRKRSRAAVAALDLVAENASQYEATVSVSLAASCAPRDPSTGERFTSGSIKRALLPRDATPNLPASLGPSVEFVTLCAALAPCTSTTLCRAAMNADDARAHPGFVMVTGGGPPPPPAAPWTGLTLLFPLDTRARVQCTQGFGGRGHHRGPLYFHSADFDAPEGTPVRAVFSGRIVSARDSTHVGGAHVDLLPEANEVSILMEGGGAVAVYLHLAPGTVCVRVGDYVREGYVIGATGNTGFSTGAHLHIHVHGGDGGEGERTIEWALYDKARGAVVPLAGHYYTTHGWSPPVDALDEIRRDIGVLPDDRAGGVGVGGSAADASRAIVRVREALLWLAPETFEPLKEDDAPLSEQSEAVALRTFPSMHTCLVCNVVAFASLLTDGAESRFASRGSIPPVYLSCAFNFDRDDETGELFSVEPSPLRAQGACKKDARCLPAVAAALDPALQSNWLEYFKRDFLLERAFEVYNGVEFKGNFIELPTLAAGEDAREVWSFKRTSLGGFKKDVLASGARAGVVIVFRDGPASAQPFGIWFGWLVVEGALVVVNIQNSRAETELEGAVSALDWEEGPREGEVFWAPLKRALQKD